MLDECYGRKDAKMEKEVKVVYEELGLEKVYLEYEQKAVGEIRAKIEKVDETEGLRKSVFDGFLGKIYKRTK